MSETTNRSEEDVEISIDSTNAEQISVQELVNRCIAQASNFGPKSKTRLVLFNAARAITELTVRLDAAMQENEQLKNPKAGKSGLVILPSVEN